jgi:hypothetical protein
METAMRRRIGVRCMYFLANLVLLLPLAACQRTLLSQSPVENAGCDAALVGHWVSLGNTREDDGELEAWLDGDCVLKAVERRNEGPREWPPIEVSTARVGSRDLLLLDAAATNQAFEVEIGPLDREGSLYAFAYRARGDELTLLPPDHRRLAMQVAAGKRKGATLVDDVNITVRLDGSRAELSKALAERSSFARREAMRFRRVVAD